MASSHIFCAVFATETTTHYQIYPTDQVKGLPGLTYQVIKLTDAFRTTYFDSASNTTSSFATRTVNCLYSCFAPHCYAPGAGGDLAVLNSAQPALNQMPSL